jgi:ABC-2 type transport system permease protein
VNPVRLVARRELTERVRERSFMVSTGVTLVIVALVVILPAALGLGGPDEFTVTPRDARGEQIAQAARALAPSLDAKVTVGEDGDVTVTGGAIRAAKEPDDTLVQILQLANRQIDAQARPPLRLVTAEPVDPDRESKSGLAFLAMLILYGQLLTYGFWVASGVVEEKSSRVIELLLAALRPKDLLAGKVIGLGLLGLGQLLIVSAFGLLAAQVTGALDVTGDLVGAVALSLAWFVLGYAFYASAFAVAGALVPRLEELQSTTMPLTMTIVISLLLGFAVHDDPDGTLAHVTAFIPTTAPITMPSRILLGAAPAWEIAASAAVTIAATVALIPLAGRVYAAVVLRTGSAVKLREAIRLAR